MALFAAEFGPGPPLGDARVDGFLHDSGADAAGRFDLFVLVVKAVRDDGFGAIFVGGDLLRGKGERVVEIVIVGPVGAAAKISGKHKMDRRERGRHHTLLI